MFNREDGQIDFTKSAQDIYNQFRGFYVWPGIFTFFENKRIKLLNIKPVEKKLQPGKFVAENGRLFVGCTVKEQLKYLNYKLKEKNQWMLKRL